MQLGPENIVGVEVSLFLYLENEMVKGKICCRAAWETDGSTQSPAAPCCDPLRSPSSNHRGPLKVSPWKAHFHFDRNVIL